MLNRREFGVVTLGAIAARSPEGSRSIAQEREGSAERKYRYIHLDVFTDKRLAGNQLLVFVDPRGLDTAAMQAITKESNYSENTFVFPPEPASRNAEPATQFRVRIFTRTAETPFAGHPTIGTAFALAHTGAIKAGTARVVFGLGVGPTPLDLEWANGKLAFAWMTQLNPTFGRSIPDTAALAAAIGLAPADVVRAPQEVNCGSNFVIVPIATRKAVDAAVIDRAKIDAVFAGAGVQRRGMYAISAERGQNDSTAYARLLPAGGIEDPATGSAAGPAGCYLAKYGLIPADRVGSMVFQQGVLAGRPSRLHVRVAMTGGEISNVQVGGTSVVVGEGGLTV